MKKTIAMLSAVALTLSLAACGGTTTTDAATDTAPAAGQVASDTLAEETTAVMGRVTSISGSTATIALNGQLGGVRTETLPAMSESNATTGSTERTTPPEKPEGDSTSERNTPPQLPDGEAPTDGNAPQMRDGGKPGDFRQNGGEEETIEVDLTAVTVTKDGETAAASDLSEGDMVRITLDESGNPVSLEVMDFRAGGQPGGMGQRPERDGFADGGQRPDGEAPSGQPGGLE